MKRRTKQVLSVLFAASLLVNTAMTNVAYAEETEQLVSETAADTETAGGALSVNESGTEYVCAVSDLEVVARWGAEDTISESGEYQVTFPGQYGQIFYRIPEEIDTARLESIVVDTDSSHFSIKLCNAENLTEEAGIVYGSNRITKANLNGNVDVGDVNVIGFMNLSEAAMTKVVKNITFYLSEEKKEGKMEYEYTLSELEMTTSWYIEIAEVETGTELLFTQQYGAASYRIPDEVDVDSLDSVRIECSDSSRLSVKFYGDEGMQNETNVCYGNNYLSAEGMTADQLKCIALMGLEENYTTVVKKVVFKMKENGETNGIEYDVPNLRDVLTEELGEDFIAGTSICVSNLSDENEMALVLKHFNGVTVGNELKPDCMFGYASKCPEKETIVFNGVEMEVPKMDFTRAEKILDYIYDYNQTHEDNPIQMRGHVLVWHSQTPEWFFHKDFDADKEYCTPEEMTVREEWYIKSVLEHFTGPDSKYKDMFYGWDVVNEAVSDSTGTYRNENENSNWWKIYGSNEYIINAFRFANKYAPAEIDLYYNDYNECGTKKSEGIAQLLTDVKNAEGTRIDGMGMQGHYATAGSPTKEEFMTAARKYGAIVDKVQVTELDFTASSEYDGTDATRSDEYTRLAYRYKDIYDAVKELKAEGVGMAGITVWGVVDKNSWLQSRNDVGGGTDGTRAQVPLLFDDNYHVKPSYWAFVDSSKLAPVIQNVTFTQKVDDCFSAGTELTFGNESTAVTAVPVWEENGISIQIKVTDTQNEPEDEVTVYADFGNGIQKTTVKREAATETADGYQTVAYLDAGKTLNNLDEILFDIVVTDGSEKTAFNDYTYSQETTTDYYAKATLKQFMVIEKGTVKVGEDNTAVWDAVPSIQLGIVLGAQAEASAKLLWDEENLYVQMHVTDSVLNADSTAVYEKDSIEVFIDENNNKTVSYEPDDKQYRINYLNEHSFNGEKCLEENVISEVKLTEDGYVVEASFKWTDITPAANQKIGLDLQLNDANADGKRSGTVNWFDETGKGWSSPAVFGTVLLKDTVGSSDDESGSEPGNGSEDGSEPGNGSEDGNEPGSGSEDGNGSEDGSEDGSEPGDVQIAESMDAFYDKLVELLDHEKATKEEKEKAVEEFQNYVSENREKLPADLNEVETVLAKYDKIIAELTGTTLTVASSYSGIEGDILLTGALLTIPAGKEGILSVREADTAGLTGLDNYTNLCAMEIELQAEQKEVVWNAPVVLSVPIPEGIQKDEEIRVLHYADGNEEKPEILVPVVSGDRLKFAVQHFSTIVIANAGTGETADVPVETPTTEEPSSETPAVETPTTETETPAKNTDTVSEETAAKETDVSSAETASGQTTAGNTETSTTVAPDTGDIHRIPYETAEGMFVILSGMGAASLLYAIRRKKNRGE